MPIKHLDFPAPHRESIHTDKNHFITRPWEISGVLSVITAGGYFEPNRHDFAPGVSGFAFTAQEIYQELVS